jgi:hypothetical protein
MEVAKLVVDGLKVIRVVVQTTAPIAISAGGAISVAGIPTATAGAAAGGVTVAGAGAAASGLAVAGEAAVVGGISAVAEGAVGVSTTCTFTSGNGFIMALGGPPTIIVGVCLVATVCIGIWFYRKYNARLVAVE